MTIEGDKITFSSGRTVIVNGGIVGISPELSITAGYDNGLWHEGMDEDDTDLTPDDLIELAEHMIFLWHSFRADMIRARGTDPRYAMDAPKADVPPVSQTFYVRCATCHYEFTADPAYNKYAPCPHCKSTQPKEIPR